MIGTAGVVEADVRLTAVATQEFYQPRPSATLTPLGGTGGALYEKLCFDAMPFGVRVRVAR